jgi:hypothetical protein
LLLAAYVYQERIVAYTTAALDLVTAPLHGASSGGAR